MSITKQIKKLEHYQLHPRSNWARTMALILTAATIFSLTDLGHDHRTQMARQEIVAGTRYAINTGSENETVRMPIKFDDGLRAPATSGQ